MKAHRLMTNRRQEYAQTRDHKMLSDAKLLTQIQTGDDASFESLFFRHYSHVYGVLYRLLGNKADAEDVTQQVFLKVYHSPQRIHLQRDQDDTNVAGWLYRVAVNMGYNTLRSRKRRQKRQDVWARLWPFTGSTPDPVSVAESNDAQARVRGVLAQMKPREAKLLLLRHSGLSYKEIAAALNVAPGSIGSLLTRAERAFAKKYRLAYPEEV